MKIALDHDGTYTNDMQFWDAFIELAHRHGHEVVCVTMRFPEESISMPCNVIYTSRQAKVLHYEADIWIDDNPRWIFTGAT